MADGATPLAWRVAALGTLGGGLAVGAAAAAGGGARWLVAGSIAAVVGALAPVMAASRRPPIAEAPWERADGPLPFVTVLVAGRDEAAHLPSLVTDLAAQDHIDATGTPRFEVVVVDDRSTDGTAAAVEAAASAAGIAEHVRVIRRDGDGLEDGKGAALAFVPLRELRGEVIVVLDADARIGPVFVRGIAGYVAAGAQAVQVRRRTLAAGESWLTGAQADEQTQDGELQRGRWALGGCAEFRGNGMAIRRQRLDEAGGWPAGTLTEDLDLSSRLAALGVTIAWAIDVEVREEPVRTWAALWRQRVRWAEGSIRRLLEHGPSVLASGRLATGAKLDFTVYGVQLLAPPLILGAAAGAVASGGTGVAVTLLLTYLAAAGVLAFDALRWEPEALPVTERSSRALRAALFGGIWLGAVPAALWRLGTRQGELSFDKTVRAPEVSA